MSYTATQGNSIIVDTPESVSGSGVAPSSPDTQVVSWVLGKVLSWETHRNNGWQRRWQEWWRMWRGQWSEEDKTRQSERSRLIAPALAQAIEQTVSEIEEGLFSKDVWLDIVDDIADEKKDDASVIRDQLLEDFETVNVKDAVSESVLNAAIFGTGIVKIDVQVRQYEKPVRNERTMALEASPEERVVVCVESIRPDDFIPDPSGRTIGEMLGCAHRIKKPLHAILEKIEAGVYLRSALPLLSGSPRLQSGAEADAAAPDVSSSPTNTDEVDVIEYHGKVPLRMLNDLQDTQSLLDEMLKADLKDRPDHGDGPLVEAIITIANEGILLRAMVNPFVMKDRCIVAYQFEKVPGRFWGRGVAEKGYNPQKALDAELRARIDALGYISSPMLGVDSGRIPRGFKLDIRPGKVWLTQGDPNEVLRPISIGNLEASTFNQTSEMERMVQMGTGAFDTASSLKSQSQSGANGASSNSLMMGAFVKRAKRAISNVDRNLMQPLIKKSIWRYMQFDPRRYPKDYEFRVVATLGIVAREVEAMQLTQLLGMMPEEFPGVKLIVAKGIIDNTAVSNKGDIQKAIEAATQPPPPEVAKKQQELAEVQFQAALAEAQGALLANQKTVAEIRKLMSESLLNMRKADVEDDKQRQEDVRLKIAFEELDQFEEQNRIARQRLDLQQQQLNLKKTEAKSAS